MTPALALLRPVNCLLTAVSVGVGALTSGLLGTPSAGAGVAVLVGAAGAALITGAGNALNDWVDVEEDRINRPDRPIPSGALDRRWALVGATSNAVGGLALCFGAGTVPGLISLGVVAGLVLYALWLKALGPAGNVLVATLAAATFPFGAIAAGAPGRSWIPALFAFLYHLARELVKGIEDASGDRQRSIRTAALRWGARTTARMAAALLLAVGLLALWPAATGLYGVAYLVPVLLLDGCLLKWAVTLWRGPWDGTRRLSRSLLVGMALGLLAICLGEVSLALSAESALAMILTGADPVSP